MFKRMYVQLLAMVALAMGSVAQVAHAALDTAVTTELAAAKTDIITLGGIVFAIAVSIVLYKWFKRAL